MSRVGYRMVKALAYGIAITPFPLLYIQSDLYAFLLYHLLRYRRKVVRANLLRSFPDKSIPEIRKIEKKFYKNFCDTALELCKLLKMTREDLEKRVRFTNPELIRGLYDKGKSLFYALPHSGNWEWFGKLMHTLSDHKCVAIYKRIQNACFEDFMLRLRTSGKEADDQMVESSQVFRTLVKRRNLKNAALIVADQSPRGIDTDYWIDFLNQDTCWFTGMEKMARKLDYAVVFVGMKRTGRGYYEVTFEEICRNPDQQPENGIIEQYARSLEHFIKTNPDNWLWSHRRWKHKRKFDLETNNIKSNKRVCEEAMA